jgi:hypothetical protein
MFHMVTRRSLAAVGLATILAAPMAWSQDASPVRVRGTIERIESPVFVVKSRDGAELKIVLAENAVAIGVVKATLADIKPGLFVGIAAMPQPDGTQRALEVLIFPEAMRGTGEGHYPWHRISAPGSEQGIVPAKTRALEGSGWPLAAHARPPPGFGDYRLSRNGRMRSVMKASSAEPLSGAAPPRWPLARRD